MLVCSRSHAYFRARTFASSRRLFTFAAPPRRRPFYRPPSGRNSCLLEERRHRRPDRSMAGPARLSSAQLNSARLGLIQLAGLSTQGTYFRQSCSRLNRPRQVRPLASVGRSVGSSALRRLEARPIRRGLQGSSPNRPLIGCTRDPVKTSPLRLEVRVPKSQAQADGQARTDANRMQPVGRLEARLPHFSIDSLAAFAG
ncbi:unnamed protein product [Protopolystoma xenopodis]|uniref:Uncharacterized protein n=1 Tax=Protopolystoma xenopodis TaxID=117903 RepID=A0A448WHP9_9PLAT|nr:unnamed protein product [Protopolystoma xenopodis]